MNNKACLHYVHTALALGMSKQQKEYLDDSRQPVGPHKNSTTLNVPWQRAKTRSKVNAVLRTLHECSLRSFLEWAHRNFSWKVVLVRQRPSLPLIAHVNCASEFTCKPDAGHQRCIPQILFDFFSAHSSLWSCLTNTSHQVWEHVTACCCCEQARSRQVLTSFSWFQRNWHTVCGYHALQLVSSDHTQQLTHSLLTQGSAKHWQSGHVIFTSQSITDWRDQKLQN